MNDTIDTVHVKSDWRLDWPSSGGGRVASALLKSTPDDFFVDEDLPLPDDLAAGGEHLCIRLEKRVTIPITLRANWPLSLAVATSMWVFADSRIAMLSPANGSAFTGPARKMKMPRSSGKWRRTGESSNTTARLESCAGATTGVIISSWF